MKTCNTCKNELNEDMFHKRTASLDGLAAKCKPCQKDYDKSRANLPHRVKARKDYANTAEGKIKTAEAKKRWVNRNAVKRFANVVVGNAVRSGKLAKPDVCESCDSKPNRLHGHHDDYAFPLVVRWLCPGCHNKWHKENGEGLNAF